MPSSFSSAQQWSLTQLANGYVKLVSRLSGLCLDDGSWPVCNADECRNEYLSGLQQYSCIDDGIQAWRLGANAIPPPPPGIVNVQNNSQLTVLSFQLNGVEQPGQFIPPAFSESFSAAPGVYSALLAVGFNQNSGARRRCASPATNRPR